MTRHEQFRPRVQSALRLRAHQVNTLLGVAVLGVIATGLLSWAVGTGWSRWFTVAHGVLAMFVLVLVPAKMSTSVRTGMRRRRATRWVSVLLGVLLLVVAGLGIVHSTGVWHGHGYWSALWSHFLLAFLVLPIVLWHVLSRPARPRRVDLDRRLLIGTGARLAIAAGVLATVEGVVRVTSLGGGDRRFTGSYDIGSFDPDAMPTVSWIDDSAPDLDPDDWPLHVDGEAVSLASIRPLARPLDATLDCTGGWYSTQHWDAVPIAELLGATSARSFVVTSATGYRRVFSMSDSRNVHVAVGYDGRPLRRGHGAPIRLIAPGRRGPWWVKWVTSIDTTDRPSWLQLPFPAT